MSRIHIMLNVADLEATTSFYQNLLGTAPTKHKPDYVQWKLDEPLLNLSMKSNPNKPYGVDHVGLEAANNAELAVLSERVTPTNGTDCCTTSGETTCCYAHSNKVWTEDPSGLLWEIFHTHGDSPTESKTSNAAAHEVHM